MLSLDGNEKSRCQSENYGGYYNFVINLTETQSYAD
jgi:hypothetical protein